MTAAARPAMSRWRLEWLRLLRTHRLVALVAVYAFFGLTSPPLARYLADILEQFGGGVQVVTPAPTALEGLATFVSNSNQIGLLVFTLVVSSAVALDSRREMAVFLRTRVDRSSELLVPRYVVSLVAGGSAFVVGVAAAWVGTVALLGPVDAAGMVAGTAASLLYLAFVAAVGAAFGARLTSAVATAGATLGVALLLGIVGSLGGIGDWLPSHLLGGLTELPFGTSVGSFAGAAAVTVAATAALLALAAHLGDRREL